MVELLKVRNFVMVAGAATAQRRGRRRRQQMGGIRCCTPATALQSEVNTVLVTSCFRTTGLDAYFEVTITHSDHLLTKVLHSYTHYDTLNIESWTFSYRRDAREQICVRSEAAFPLSMHEKNTN